MRTMWLAIALAACSGTKEGGADWSGRPLIETAGKVGDATAGTLAYTIQLPKGLSPDPHTTGGITIGYEANEGGHRDFKAPSVMVGYDAIPPKSLDEAVQSAMPDPTNEVVRKDPIPGGFIVTTRGKSHKHWKVDVTKIAGDKGVGCMAQQANDDAELGDATRALLEKICLSLVVK